MKSVELWEILVSLSGGEISLTKAHDQILELFGEEKLTYIEGNISETLENLEKEIDLVLTLKPRM